MKTVTVKELMVPLKEYATVPKEATLREAVLALEKAQMTLDPLRHKHRAILVALEPNYGKVEGVEVLERSGYSPDLIRSMLKDNVLWSEPLQFVCERATKLKVSDFIQAPLEGEYIDEKATLGEATHQFVVYPYQSLLVTSSDEVVGILRLSDVFTKICDTIKDC